MPRIQIVLLSLALSLSAATTGKGPKTIILVHGWTSQVPALSKDFRDITMDLLAQYARLFPQHIAAFAQV